MYKKLVSLVLATVMLLGMLAGCSSNNEDIDVEAADIARGKCVNAN